MPAPLTIDQANAKDAATVADFVTRLLAELFDSARDPEEMEATARDLLARPDLFTAFIARRGAQPVGVLTLATCVSVYASGRFGEIAELCVDPDQRSAGVGEALIAAAADYGRQQGWSRLEVGAPPAERWARTVAFYERNGFTEIGPRLGLALTP
ncbi:MAG: GNAT family N-acetyltransferase [Pseudomonadota bacterium]